MCTSGFHSNLLYSSYCLITMEINKKIGQNFKILNVSDKINRGSSVGVVTRIGDGRPKAFVSISGKEKGFLCSLV